MWIQLGVIIPAPLCSKVLSEIHINHPGIERMKNLACSYIWWPSLDENLEHVANSCKSYQVNRNMPSKALMHPWENAKSPWVRIHEGFAETYVGKMFIVLVDSYSKWFYVIPMSNANTTLLVEFLTFFCYSWFTFCYSNQ